MEFNSCELRSQQHREPVSCPLRSRAECFPSANSTPAVYKVQGVRTEASSGKCVPGNTQNLGDLAWECVPATACGTSQDPKPGPAPTRPLTRGASEPRRDPGFSREAGSLREVASLLGHAPTHSSCGLTSQPSEDADALTFLPPISGPCAVVLTVRQLVGYSRHLPIRVRRLQPATRMVGGR